MINKVENIVSIDLEFNRLNEPLSIGITNHKETREFYIKNKVDKNSFNIHGLTENFLKETGMQFSKVKEIIDKKLDQKIILGFDIKKDLFILKIKQINKLYSENKIIDLKDLFTLIGVHTSLSNIYKSLEKNNELFKTNTIHTASFDSILNFKILEKIIYSAKKYNISEEEIISKLTNLTFLSQYAQKWELEELEKDFSWLKKELESLNFFKNVKIIKNKKDFNKPIYINRTKKFIFLYDSNKYLLFKIPIKYSKKYNLKNLINLNIETNNLDFGIKFITK